MNPEKSLPRSLTNGVLNNEGQAWIDHMEALDATERDREHMDGICDVCDGAGSVTFNPDWRNDPQHEQDARCGVCSGTGEQEAA